jgi:hypothetical protein
MRALACGWYMTAVGAALSTVSCWVADVAVRFRLSVTETATV